MQVVHTGYASAPTIELTWALILAALAISSPRTHRCEAADGSIDGDDMAGRTLGVLGLGNVGGAVARIGNAFGMKVIAWNQNLTNERAAEVGRHAGGKGRAVPTDGRRLHPSGAQRQDARPRRRAGAGAHEPTARLITRRADRSWSRPISLRRLKTRRSLVQP